MTKEQYRKFAFVTHELDQLVKKSILIYTTSHILSKTDLLKP